MANNSFQGYVDEWHQVEIMDWDESDHLSQWLNVNENDLIF